MASVPSFEEVLVVVVPFGLLDMMGVANVACSPNDETWSSPWEEYCTVDTWLERKICSAVTSNNHKGKIPRHRTAHHDVGGGHRRWPLKDEVDDDDDDRRAIAIPDISIVLQEMAVPRSDASQKSKVVP